MAIRSLLASALWLVSAIATAHPPVVQPAVPFASALDGPEGLAFGRDGVLYVGTNHGQIRRVASDGTDTLVADVGERFAGVTVLRDGRILACAFGAGHVWSVDPATGTATVYANVDSPNFVVQTRTGHVYASSSFGQSIVDITNGAHVVVATGFVFPNGLAVRKGSLYVADTGTGSVVRLSLANPSALGPSEVYGTGMVFADGIVFDRPGNLFVVGAGALYVVDVITRAVTTLPADPLFSWPSNIAFGRTNAYGKSDMFFANYGPALGDGTTVVRVPTNHPGARLIR